MLQQAGVTFGQVWRSRYTTGVFAGTLCLFWLQFRAPYSYIPPSSLRLRRKNTRSLQLIYWSSGDQHQASNCLAIRSPTKNHTGTSHASRVIDSKSRTSCSSLNIKHDCWHIHSGDWFFALPVTFCGLRLNNEAVRVAMTLRLTLFLNEIF